MRRSDRRALTEARHFNPYTPHIDLGLAAIGVAEAEVRAGSQRDRNDPGA